MSQLMEQAILKVRELPEPEQEAIASIILQEIESESRWDELFARPKSADLSLGWRTKLWPRLERA